MNHNQPFICMAVQSSLNEAEIYRQSAVTADNKEITLKYF